MWYLWAFRTMRAYAPYVTLPFAAVVGYLGYKFEGAISSKYTPYKEPIKEARNERQLTEESLRSAADVEKLKYSANVLGKNLSPSLQ
ncbi:small integral membrane protein 12-A [Onthophagus taurus]|uniref:small integral membrane protein 12-A n=1 Tax=Onthophagus taurus TaxID=166361 RepID=UPI000C1FDAA8|nr:small integral membrane protein 12-A [Onthophagus taurus]